MMGLSTLASSKPRDWWNVGPSFGTLWRLEITPIFVGKSQCCTVTWVFYSDILAYEAVSATNVVCTYSVRGTMDHIKGVNVIV